MDLKFAKSDPIYLLDGLA